MPGGRQNPLSVTNIVEQLGNAVNKAKDKKHEKTSSLKQKMSELGLKNPYVDLSIKVSQVYNRVESWHMILKYIRRLQFIGASGLPKMDVVGSADPYFVAKLDDEISFVFVCLFLFSCCLIDNLTI